MKEVVLITGTGIISQRLSEILKKNNFSVRFLSRTKKNFNYYKWDIKNDTIEEGSFKNVQHIIHLAGANISNKKWSSKRKKELVSSRVNSTKLIIKTLKNRNIKIKSFITASAIGFYGAKTTNIIYKENSLKGNDFLSNLCYKWENVANLLNKPDFYSRVVKIRIGIVLSKRSGALEKMINPLKFYIGASLGSGKQYMPWIHIDDLCNIFIFSINNKKINGVYNAVAPEHITNNEFITLLAKKLKKPLFLPNIPSSFLKLIFGEMATILLEGSRVSSNKIITSGYNFKFKTVSKALNNLLIEKQTNEHLGSNTTSQ